MESRKAWTLWFLLACAAIAIHLLTLRLSPTIWRDEVQIVEFGRTALTATDRDWSINLSVQGQPIRTLCYLCCCLQEQAFRLAGKTEIGPRVASLLGAVFAGSCMLGWLLSRGTRPVAALVCASLLLFDPVFAQSYRGARVDCWAFGFLFVSCWAVWLAAANAKLPGRLRSTLYLIAAGAAFAFSGLCWASALLLIPLLVHELVSAYQIRFTTGKMLLLLRLLLLLAGSTAVALLLLLTPEADSVAATLTDLTGEISVVSEKVSASSSLLAVAKSYRFSPWLFAFGLLSFLVPCNRLLGVAFLLALCGVVVTHAYIYRALYLLPYLLLGLSGLFAYLARLAPPRPLLAKCAVGATVLLLCWDLALTFALRPWTALQHQTSRHPDRLKEAISPFIRKQNAVVYSPRWELYYLGRRMGWHLVNFSDSDRTGNYTLVQPFLSNIDFVVLREGDASNQQIQSFLSPAGFSRINQDLADLDGGNPNKEEPPSFVASGYGKYLVYGRAQPVSGPLR